MCPEDVSPRNVFDDERMSLKWHHSSGGGRGVKFL